MLFRIDHDEVAEVGSTKASHVGFQEADIESWIEKRPEILGEDLLVIGLQVEMDESKDRIDLLAIGHPGNAVVVELKRPAFRVACSRTIRIRESPPSWAVFRPRPDATRSTVPEGFLGVATGDGYVLARHNQIDTIFVGVGERRRYSVGDAVTTLATARSRRTGLGRVTTACHSCRGSSRPSYGVREVLQTPSPHRGSLRAPCLGRRARRGTFPDPRR